ncbi:MAG: NUDIX hydrolase, partial [Dietzia sp.]|nr:NUDIX hydrolase [Dietzia sp.]
MNERVYRDSSGRALTEYPRPSVAVDTALLTLDGDVGLAVLEVRRNSGKGWGLP